MLIFYTGFKLKAFADDTLNVAERLKFVCERVENTVGKGEIAHYEQFLLFQQCFQKTCTTRLVWEWVKTESNKMKRRFNPQKLMKCRDFTLG